MSQRGCGFLRCRVLALVWLGAASSGFGLSNPASSPPSDDRVISPWTAADEDLAQLADFTIQSIAPSRTAADAIEIAVELDGLSHTIRLHPHTVRSADFRVLTNGGDGNLVTVDVPASATLRGQVVGRAGSVVTGLQDGERFVVNVDLPGGSTWHVQPFSGTGQAAAAADAHVVYKESDVLPGNWGCGHGSAIRRSMTLRDLQLPTGSGGTAGTGWKIAAVAFDADVEMFQLNGSSVAATVADIENILNQVSAIYETQANLTYELTTVVVRTAEPDPYSATENNALLIQFKNEWNNNMQGVHRDVAHLMTGKQIDGTVIGTAYNGTVCEVCGNAEGYGFSQSRYTTVMANRVALTAHELGHNWGATHCDGNPACAIMCSNIGACSGNVTSFEPQSLNTILSGINAAMCLNTLADPLEPPFCDRFDSSISNASWSYNAIASISAAALNPPSPPNVMVLNACCTGCANAPDEIRSNFMRLGGEASITLSYHTQHGGGAGTAGAQLIIEYWNTAGDWVELNRITSNGVAQSVFDFWTHSLPADALHDEFRLRMRLATGSGQPSWFVDDISVIAFQPDSPVLHVRANATAGGDGTSWANAYDDLQDALAVARCAAGIIQEVWVAEGTYFPDRGTNDRAATFQLIDDIAILGGFAGYESRSADRNPELYSTVLSGDIGGINVTGDNSYHVVTGSAVGPTAVLDGFTITRGNANGSAPHNTGGGVLNSNGSPTLRRCRIQDNLATSGGGVLNTTGSAPLFNACTFLRNRATSISGGAMANLLGSTPTMERCVFHGNSATASGGAMHNATSSAVIANSIFVGNTAMSGAAINNSGSSVTLTNCTLSANEATGAVGGVQNTGSSSTLLNTILWANRDSSGATEAAQISGFVTADYSCIQDADPNDDNVFAGVDNLDDDPQFVRAPSHGGDGWGVGNNDDYGDLRLGASSMCADSGDPAFAPLSSALDLEGHARVLCGVVDRGAYESAIGDSDCNTTVELADFADWTACVTGPGGELDSPDCLPFDFDGDGDIDLFDFGHFSQYYDHP